MEGKGESVLLLSVRKLSSDQYVVNKFKCSENLVNFLAKEIMLQNHLRFAFCLHSCHLSVRLLCPFPGFAFSSATKAKYISWFVLNFSSALSVPFLSLYVIFFFSIICPFCPYFFVLFLEQTIPENMLSCLPCIFFFTFHWQKPHGCLCRAPGCTFTGHQAFLCNSSYSANMHRRKSRC